MIEREIKIMVSDYELFQFAKKFDALAISKKILQINYYFDTQDFLLASQGSTLRIRQKENQLVLQYKYEKQNNGAENTSKEFEKEIRSFSSHITSAALPNDIIGASAIITYDYIGTLITERTNYLYNDVEVSLDKNHYLGKSDCEIELEFQEYEQVKSVLGLFFVEDIEFSTTGKYSRFVKELQKISCAGANNGC